MKQNNELFVSAANSAPSYTATSPTFSLLSILPISKSANLCHHWNTPCGEGLIFFPFRPKSIREFLNVFFSRPADLNSVSPGQTIATCQRTTLGSFRPRLHGSGQIFARTKNCTVPPCVYTGPAELDEYLNGCASLRGPAFFWLLLAQLWKPTTLNTSQHVAAQWPNPRNMLRPMICCNRVASALRLSLCCFQRIPVKHAS